VGRDAYLTWQTWSSAEFEAATFAVVDDGFRGVYMVVGSALSLARRGYGPSALLNHFITRRKVRPAALHFLELDNAERRQLAT